MRHRAGAVVEKGVRAMRADARQDDREPARWLRWMARCGIVAEGLIYVLLGVLALLVAFNPGRRAQGSGSALATLGGAPWGTAMLLVLALGLAAFVLWKGIQALFDPEHRRDRWTLKRISARLGCLLNAGLHAVLVGDAAWYAFGPGGSGTRGGQIQAHWTGQAMQLPLGRWAVAATGVGIVVFGLFQFYRAATGVKDPGLDLSHTRLRVPLIALGVFGCVARGLVFALVGAFLVRAAWRYDAAHATGIAGALSTLQERAYGSWLLGAVALGLIAYGMFQIAKARFRVICVR